MKNLQSMSFEEYLELKKEVLELYNKMMTLHAEKRRDAIYANARYAYMEKRNVLQQVIELHPEYAEKSP